MSKNKNKQKAPRLAGQDVEARARSQNAPMSEDLPFAEEEEDDDEEFDPAADQVKIVSLYAGTVRFNIAGRKFKMREGEIAQIEGAYGTPRLFRQGADPLPSVVELETGKKVLPVLDPRVDKDDDGVPLITRQAQQRRQAKSATAAPVS